VRATRRQDRAGRPRRPRALTLVELLVVLLVIALLVSALLPALLHARRQAWRSVCQTRLWQLGLAFHWYRTDHGDRMPPLHAGYYLYYAKKPEGPVGIGLLYDRDYLTVPKLLFCPRGPDWLRPGLPDTVPLPGQTEGKWWCPKKQKGQGGKGTGTNRGGYWTWFSTWKGGPGLPDPRGPWYPGHPGQAWLTCFNVSPLGPVMNHVRPNVLYADLGVSTLTDPQVATLRRLEFWWNTRDYGVSQFGALDRHAIEYTTADRDRDRGHGNEPNHFDEDNPAQTFRKSVTGLYLPTRAGPPGLTRP
jgi:prepilin-type N-terminal cleavage/methylation domain-containing protein